ncbi:hypothetical protein [Chryseobacterium sp. FH1]|uniref:hypothetical protein n=1 Tax=Chryseobacterium sp. FH1 TaxID=1233951 RepID=UPI0004E2EED7|nr:hypothetical protein [Chryseobacterium sp. FH1]KFC20173.1 hypothetical protein IO90_13330 [Chryseobacterium sp. FH1]
MKYSAKDIVYQGKKFENASVILEQKTIEENQNNVNNRTLYFDKQSLNHNLEPAFSLFGFSLELYIKGIFYFIYKKPLHGHHLKELFDSLDYESKISVKDYFENNKEKYIKQHENIFIDNQIEIISFEETLFELSDVFVKVRYMFENINLEKNLSLRELIRQGIVNRINELNFLDYSLD